MLESCPSGPSMVSTCVHLFLAEHTGLIKSTSARTAWMCCYFYLLLYILLEGLVLRVLRVLKAATEAVVSGVRARIVS